MTGETDPPTTPPPTITEPPVDPTVTPPVVTDDGMAARIDAIESSVTAVTTGMGALTDKLDAILNPKTDAPADPPSTNPEVLKLQGELDLIKTAFAQDTAAKLAEVNARKTEVIDTIISNNPVYAAQKETLALQDEGFLAMLAEQSKPAEPRTRVAGGDKYTKEDFQTQAARLRDARRKDKIR